MGMNDLFESWGGVLRVALVGTLAYAALVLVLRISGKRTLSKMNAFDLVITVALGSTLATVILSKDVALVEGIVAFALLSGLQFVVTWSSVRSSRIDRLVKAEPTLLFYRGSYLPGQMRSERVVEAEITAAVRQQGIASLEAVEAVVLETDGSFTVIPASDRSPSALNGLLREAGLLASSRSTSRTDESSSS